MTGTESRRQPTRFVDSAVSGGDPVRIAVYEEGRMDGPTVVLVHGWPDSHVLWNGVVPLLADTFRIVRYDNRGVGRSAVPEPYRAYSMARYADDFAAVIDVLSPDAPVHVLAHDWGSIGIWEFLSRPEAADRVASFTSVSGPSADHTALSVLGNLKRPYRPKPFLLASSQVSRLGYMALFSAPVLPALATRAFVARRVQRRQRVIDGIQADQLHYSETFVCDAANSIKIYRANYFQSMRRPRRDHYIRVPVQLILGTRDPFIRPFSCDNIGDWVPRLWRRDLNAGHWSPFSHPQVLAESLTELVDHLDGKPAARGLLEARVGRQRGVVTSEPELFVAAQIELDDVAWQRDCT